MPRISRHILVLELLTILIFVGCDGQKNSSLLIHGGIIYTMNPDNPTVEAVLVRDGKITYTGCCTIGTDLIPAKAGIQTRCKNTKC